MDAVSWLIVGGMVLVSGAIGWLIATTPSKEDAWRETRR